MYDEVIRRKGKRGRQQVSLQFDSGSSESLVMERSCALAPGKNEHIEKGKEKMKKEWFLHFSPEA